MPLTPIFNSAAAGPGDESESVGTGPGPQGPGGPGQTAASEFDYAQGEAADPAYLDSQHIASPRNAFNQTDETKDPPHTTSRRVLTLEAARAELEMLEKGRATLSTKFNLNPPRRTQMIVDRAVERRREARASALRAFIDFREADNAREMSPDPEEDPELTL